MLRIGDRPEYFSLPNYAGGTKNIDSSFCSNKITLISFVDIDHGWDWLYYLLELRRELFSNTDLQIVAVIFQNGGSIDGSMISQKFSAIEKRFTSDNLKMTPGFFTLIDGDHIEADLYINGFLHVNDSSFSGNQGISSWSFLVSKQCYVADKWSTNCIANNDPVSFRKFRRYVASLRIPGSFGSGNSARLSLPPIIPGSNYIDISYNSTQKSYSYAVTKSSGKILSIRPTNGTASSFQEPIVIEFDEDVPGIEIKQNYTLTKPEGSDLEISGFDYSRSFDSQDFGIAERYVKQRMLNLLATPKVMQVNPPLGSVIKSLPGNKINIAFSKPVGTMIAGPPDEKLLDVANITKPENYTLQTGSGLALSPPPLYNNSGFRADNIENVGKIENVVSLKFTGSLADGPVIIRVNDNAVSADRIQDTEGNFPEGNNGDPYYTISYTADVSPPRVVSARANPHLEDAMPSMEPEI